MGKKVCYCILHYKNIEVTLNCIDSILKINDEFDTDIVVVDNGSKNGTGEILKERYCNNKNVHCIINLDNLGFSKGNNIAYRYAKEELNDDAIIVMNSDMIIDNNFSSKFIQQKLCLSNADVICPDIINKFDNHQNPLRVKRLDKNKYMFSIIKSAIIIFLISIPVIGRSFCKKYLKRKNSKNIEKKELIEFDYNDFIPHGACLVYTNRWVREKNIAFEPITFMYCEEDILYELIKRENYKLEFIPELKIKHLEDASLDFSYKDIVKRVRFRLFQQIKSIVSYLKYLRKN